MIPVLHGVWASGGLAGDFEHIETQTVGAGGAASVTFSSIPGTYKHLEIRGIARTTYAYANTTIVYRCNSDSAANYSVHLLYGDGSAASSTAGTNTTHAQGTLVSANTGTANVFGAIITQLLDYANTSKYKTFRHLGGVDLNTTDGGIRLNSGSWRNTNAVTSLTILDFNGGNFAQYSTFSLYGCK